MATVRLEFVNSYCDRHGKRRHYFRRRGQKRIPLPGSPGSPEFMAAYQAALANIAPPAIGQARTQPGTINAAIVSFYGSNVYQSLRSTTQAFYRRTLENFRRKHGDFRLATLQRKHIQAILATKAGKPEGQRNLLRTLRQMLNHAVEQGMIETNPTFGIKLRHKSHGFHTWTEEEIAQFESRWPAGTKQRLAFGLLLYTAQRRGDVITMGRQHIRQGVLYVTQSKTGVSLEIPVHPVLASILAATVGEHLTFVVNGNGTPFTAQSFGNWFRKQCRAAGLPKDCASHGLRKAACRRLAEAGCTVHQIMAISGHKTLTEVERYTREAERARMAKTAMQMTAAAFPGQTANTQ